MCNGLYISKAKAIYTHLDTGQNLRITYHYASKT